MKGINAKEARLLEQRSNTTIASTTRKDLIKFLENDVNIVSKAMKQLDESELYKSIGKKIEDKAQELVDTKCKPERDRISEEMKPLGEERNKLAKEKAEVPEDGTREKEKEDRLAEIDKQLSDLSLQYQKITDEANSELNEYKEEILNKEQGAMFMLEDEEYDIVGKHAGF